MRIIVPSLGRAGSANSMNWLKNAERPITFAVHTDEIDSYKRAYPFVQILELPDSCRHHTGLVRREIMKEVREPFIFVDDDIRVVLKSVSTVPDMFKIIEHHMECGATMAGLAPQYFSTDATTYLINGDAWACRNKFVATVYAIDPLIFDNCPLEELPVYEDVALVIHAIQYGGGTIVTYAATHTNVSPLFGGCNAWRDKPIILESLKRLVELYPEYCSIRDTLNTTHSHFIGLGLRTAWSKIRKIQ